MSAEFVWRMEDVLDLYAEPSDAQYRGICCDESPYQLVGEVRQPALAAPVQPVRYDDEDRREGPWHVFMCVPPLGGWRAVTLTARRTAPAAAPCLQELVDSHFPQATLIRVVLDHRNTHTPAAFYETCAPAADPGLSLYAPAWELAQDGGARGRGAVNAVVEPPDPRPSDGPPLHGGRGSRPEGRCRGH